MKKEEIIAKIKNISTKKNILIILLIIAIFGLYGSFYFYNKYKELSTDANTLAIKETERLVGLLSKLMELPTEETPTIATISDKEKLKNQDFFAQAENGDVLFAYTTSMKAILYRPSSNKIVNVAPITINQAQDIKEGTER
jgi:hypothetical protein